MWAHWLSGVCCCRATPPAPRPPSPPVSLRLVATIGLERGLDTLVWQLIASVAAPGYTIHTLVALAAEALRRAEEAGGDGGAAAAAAAAAAGVPLDTLVEAVNKSVPTAVGLLGERGVSGRVGGRGCGGGRCCPTDCSHPPRPPSPPAIPFIVHPIDSGVHALLNATLRPALRRYICERAGGAEAGLAICRECSGGNGSGA